MTTKKEYDSMIRRKLTIINKELNKLYDITNKTLDFMGVDEADEINHTEYRLLHTALSKINGYIVETKKFVERI